jgi:hypothetical protein
MYTRSNAERYYLPLLKVELSHKYLTDKQKRILAAFDDAIEDDDLASIKVYQRDYEELLQAVPYETRRLVSNMTLLYKGVPINKP